MDFKQYLQYINNCDRGQPLISETGLGYHLDMIPLDRVQPSHFTRLKELNKEQLITTRQGLARDYRGLAELMGFSNLDIETHFRKSINPTKSVIEAFIYKNHDNRGDQPTSLNDLIKMIERIERYDVVDDLIPELIKIAAQCSPSNLFDERYIPIDSSKLPIDSDPDTLVSSTRLLTIDDTRQPFEACYDAFVCYAPEDHGHAESLISYLEQRGKTVATASDLLPGNFEHDSLVQLIDTRCRKVIIILTPNFLRSKECEFQTKFASEIGIKAGLPKIIPVLCEACNDSSLPPLIKVISKIDLTNPQSRTWQLSKLLGSLIAIAENPIDYPHNHNQPYLGRIQRLQEQLMRHDSRFISATSLRDPPSSPNLSDANTNSPNNKFEPIVELMHSEASDQGSCESESHKDNSSIDKYNSNKALHWLGKKFRRATSGSQSVSNRSSSSRAGLLSDSSSELISEECPVVNMRT